MKKSYTELTIDELTFIHERLYKLKISYCEKVQDSSSENINQLNDDLEYISRLHSKVGNILVNRLLEPSYGLDELE